MKEKMKYRKKPVVVEAYQVMPGGTRPHVHDWPDERGCQPRDMSVGYIETLEGRMHVHFLDWIITGVKGEHYPCKPDIFEMTYEKA